MNHQEQLLATFKDLGVQVKESSNVAEQEEAPVDAATYVSVTMANFYFDKSGTYLGIECSNVKGDYIPAKRD